MEAHSGLKSTEPVPCSGSFQNGNSRDHQTLPSAGRVGHFAGFQRCLLSHHNKPKVTKISQIPHKRLDFSIHCPSLWPVDGSVGVHQGGQGGKTNGTGTGYLNPPVPRRLVTESPLPENVPTTYPDPFGPMSLSGLGSQHGIRTSSPTSFRLCRISFRPISRPSQTHLGQMDGSILKDQPSVGSGDLLGQAIHVPNRSSNGHRETGCLGTFIHEAPPVKVRKRLPHKFARTQSSPLGLKTVRAMVLQPDRSCLHGQHHCGLLHQQGRGYEVRLSLCPPLETASLVQPKQIILRARHIPGHLNVIADKLSRHNQVIQTE